MSKEIDLATMKKLGMIKQKQDGYYALRLRALAGDLNAKQLRKVADVAEKYGNGNVHLTTRQGIEVHFVKQEELEDARLELAEVGIDMGACGPRIRGCGCLPW